MAPSSTSACHAKPASTSSEPLHVPNRSGRQARCSFPTAPREWRGTCRSRPFPASPSRAGPQSGSLPRDSPRSRSIPSPTCHDLGTRMAPTQIDGRGLSAGLAPSYGAPWHRPVTRAQARRAARRQRGGAERRRRPRRRFTARISRYRGGRSAPRRACADRAVPAARRAAEAGFDAHLTKPASPGASLNLRPRRPRSARSAAAGRRRSPAHARHPAPSVAGARPDPRRTRPPGRSRARALVRRCRVMQPSTFTNCGEITLTAPNDAERRPRGAAACRARRSRRAAPPGASRAARSGPRRSAQTRHRRASGRTG